MRKPSQFYQRVDEHGDSQCSQSVVMQPVLTWSKGQNTLNSPIEARALRCKIGACLYSSHFARNFRVLLNKEESFKIVHFVRCKQFHGPSKLPVYSIKLNGIVFLLVF